MLLLREAVVVILGECVLVRCVGVRRVCCGHREWVCHTKEWQRKVRVWAEVCRA